MRLWPSYDPDRLNDLTSVELGSLVKALNEQYPAGAVWLAEPPESARG